MPFFPDRGTFHPGLRRTPPVRPGSVAAAIARMHVQQRYRRRALPFHRLQRALLPAHRMPIALPRDAHLPPVSPDNIENALNVARGIGTVIPVTAPYFAAIQAIEHIPVVGPAVKAIGEAPIRATLAVATAVGDFVSGLFSGGIPDMTAADYAAQLKWAAAQPPAKGGGGRIAAD